jgi:hypothetical protein
LLPYKPARYCISEEERSKNVYNDLVLKEILDMLFGKVGVVEFV